MGPCGGPCAARARRGIRYFSLSAFFLSLYSSTIEKIDLPRCGLRERVVYGSAVVDNDCHARRSRRRRLHFETDHVRYAHSFRLTLCAARAIRQAVPGT